jgi:HD-GYP domain-containing protein (c-di-GMP phosphodiesterase class II)
MAVLPTARALQRLSSAGVRLHIRGRELPKVNGRIGLMRAVRRINKETGSDLSSFQIARNIRAYGSITGVTSLSLFGITDLDPSSIFDLSDHSAGRLCRSFVHMYEKKSAAKLKSQFDYLQSFFSRANMAETSLEKALVVKMLLDALEAHHPETLQHSLNVLAINNKIANKMGLPEETVRNLNLASALHDLGKFAMAVALLNKLGKLPPNDIARIRLHVDVGVGILREISWIPESVRTDVFFHHYTKRYPFNALPENAPLTARIIVVSDSYDKITTPQVYKKSTKTPAQAIADLRTSKLPETEILAYDQEIVSVFENDLKGKGLI